MKSESVFLKYMKNLRGKQLLLLLCVAGILFLLLGGRLTGTKKSETAQPDSDETYRASLETELTELCREVRGVGAVRVMITVGTGTRTVTGVAVVCGGGGDPSVRAELTELLTSLLGVGSHRVHIGEMNQA